MPAQWAGYFSAGAGYNLGWSYFNIFGFNFGVSNFHGAGPVYGISEPVDYTKWYLISSLSAFAIVGANLTAFRSPDDSSFGFTTEVGLVSNVGFNIGIAAQYYWQINGFTNALAAASYDAPPNDSGSQAERMAYRWRNRYAIYGSLNSLFYF